MVTFNLQILRKVEAPDKDNETIFSEFQDPERITLVHRIFNIMGNAEMPRSNLFLLWFSSKEQLEHIARESEDCDPDSSSSVNTKYLMNGHPTSQSDYPTCEWLPTPLGTQVSKEILG
ncbi:hypothetical protein N7493_005837 [Penicillium malachiteum]|uniref:Uncharacterized protein n=1 Tax=Penicillium malachiteum TaxID=1324776 RepID=A0AAD6MVT3_9EURO|nr:hypothetical protein N7493_005837 [Penicillium malachiteum]